MIDFDAVYKPGKAVQIGVNCGICAVALGLLLYVLLMDVDHTWEVLTAFWLCVVSVALIAFIPVEASFNFLAELPLSVQIASLTAWLWALCVCRNLVKYGVTGPVYRNMVITKHVLLSVLVVIVSVMLMKKGLFIVLLLLGSLVGAINADIINKKQMESAQ